MTDTSVTMMGMSILPFHVEVKRFPPVPILLVIPPSNGYK